MVARDPRVGMVLHDRYKLLEHVTAGTMGIVYRGERIGLGRTVAVKILNDSFASNDDGIRRFEVEARAMSRLSHPNCVGVIDFGVAGGAPYLVMDFVYGRTLREIIRDDVRLDPRRAVHIVRQLVAGLSHAHAQGIIHRDIKPENIIISNVEGQGEQARILDFGLAKLRDNKSVTTGLALGTPGYMSPEQTIGRKVDHRADIYAVGIILYEMLVGRKPFQSPDVFEVMRMHREVPPPRPSQQALGTRLSSKLEAVVLRALAKDPDARFASMNELGIALDQTPEAGHGGVSRRGAILIGLGAAAFAAIVVVAFAVDPGTDADAPAKTKPHAAKKHARHAAPPAEPTPTAAPEMKETAPEEHADDIAALRKLAGDGKLDEALDGLEQLAHRAPRRAEVQYALGNLYTETQRWVDAVNAYHAAITLDAAFRNDERLMSDVVEALADEDSHEAAAQLLANEIGAAALPRLDEATRSSNPELRDRARTVSEAIGGAP